MTKILPADASKETTQKFFFSYLKKKRKKKHKQIKWRFYVRNHATYFLQETKVFLFWMNLWSIEHNVENFLNIFVITFGWVQQQSNPLKSDDKNVQEMFN